MGDVALLTPVLKSFLSAYPNQKITLVSRPKFAPFFFNLPNLNFLPADVDSAYSGVLGIIKLFNQLKKLKPEMVIDVHDHLRTRFICFLFRIIGVKVVRFEKGRKEKKELTRRENKIRRELPHTINRYADAFSKAGFSFPILPAPFIYTSPEAEEQVIAWLARQNLVKDKAWFGLAPFAAHKTKIWPIENYFKLIEESKSKVKARFFLFGGGPVETSFFQQLKTRFPEECVIVAGELRLPEELALMKRLDKMICTDSSNMHLATMMGVPTISIWGGTHPSTGFSPFGGERNTIIQIDPKELPCRPCSVYGKETCWRGDMACLNRIPVQSIVSEL
jgi:ADP-heptose:LPS heptosyltransferase